MKKTLFVLISLVIAAQAFGQYDDDATSNPDVVTSKVVTSQVDLVTGDEDVITTEPDLITQRMEPKAAMTFGILNGGGGLVGADLEFLVADRVGIQLGAGLVSYGVGINYHLGSGIRTSMINFGLWHQGVGQTHTQTLVGQTYIYRARKLFTSQIGLGFLVKEGPAWPADKTHSPVMLLYSIGFYLPL